MGVLYLWPCSPLDTFGAQLLSKVTGKVLVSLGSRKDVNEIQDNKYPLLFTAEVPHLWTVLSQGQD